MLRLLYRNSNLPGHPPRTHQLTVRPYGKLTPPYCGRARRKPQANPMRAILLVATATTLLAAGSGLDSKWQQLTASGIAAYQRGEFGAARQLIEVALLTARDLGPSDSRVASSLSNLAAVEQAEARYDQAEGHYREALGLWNIPSQNQALVYHNLGTLCRVQGRLKEAAEALEGSLRIFDQIGAPEIRRANGWANLGMVYKALGRSGEAESLYDRALKVQRRELGDRHPDTVSTWNRLGDLYASQGKTRKAEKALLAALAGWDAQPGGRKTPGAAITINNLAYVRMLDGRDTEAEELYREALHIAEAGWGSLHPETAMIRHNLAQFYRRTSRLDEAIALFEQAVENARRALGPDHARVAALSLSLSVALLERGDHDRAVAEYRRVVRALGRLEGRQKLDLARQLEVQAAALRARELYAEAAEMEMQAVGAKVQVALRDAR